MMTAKFRGLLSALLVATAFACSALLSAPAMAQQKTLKFVPQADLRILDPIWTTAYITRNHGYMVYDTLFSVNDKFEVQAADGRQATRSARQADLHLHAARRPQIP